MTEKKQGAQAVVRALRILKLFNGGSLSLSLQDVIKQTDLNRTTAFRLLTTLTGEGFLLRCDDGKYQLGPELTALGGVGIRQDSLRRVAHPILQNLVTQVNERATLEVRSTDLNGFATMLVIDEVVASHRLSIRDFTGNHLPIYATSTGKAYLAHVSKEEQENLLNQPLETFTNETVRSAQEIQNELIQIKKNGYAVANEELEEGLVALGVPVFNGQGEVCAAICLAGPSVRMTADRLPELIGHLKAHGIEISAQNGWRQM